MDITKRIKGYRKHRGKVSVPGWSSNPRLVHEVGGAVAMVIFREARKAGLTIDPGEFPRENSM